jgi:hypothetical protein
MTIQDMIKRHQRLMLRNRFSAVALKSGRGRIGSGRFD